MYANLTAAPVLKTSTTAATVFPTNKGEYGHHTFQFTHTDDLSEDITEDQEIWVFFDSTHYDYYVGDAEIWFEGDLDEDGHEIYYIPCIVWLDEDDPLQSPVCWTKRHSIRVSVGVDISSDSVVNIRFVGIRNPKPSTALTYYITVMDEGETDEYDHTWERVDYYLITTITFTEPPVAYLDLHSVKIITTGDAAIGLRGTADYQFLFGVFETSSAASQTVFLSETS